jgi:anti-repressor protein
MNLQKFTNKEFGEIRTLEKDNEVWFVGRDIADILQYKETHKAISRLVDEDDRMKYPVKDSLGRMQDTWLINESGLYSLILNSKLETAKKFKKWVTSDILPSIRQHGAYMTPETIEKTLTDPDFLIKLASSLKEEQEKRRLAEAELEETRPKAIFADSVANSKSTILIRDLAKILKGNGIDIGEKRLFKWMREKGYLIKQKGRDYNSPTQRAMDIGLFRIKESTITHSDGRVTINKTPLVTGKGQTYFVRKFLMEMEGLK